MNANARESKNEQRESVKIRMETKKFEISNTEAQRRGTTTERVSPHKFVPCYLQRLKP